MFNLFTLLTAGGKISPEMVYLVLLLPVIATAVAITRQVIGVKMLGAFAPIIATYAFLGTGLANGVLIACIIFLATMLLRYSTKKLRIHYLPKVAILLTCVCIITLILMPLSIYIPIFSFTTVSSSAIILYILLSDTYLSSEIQNGYKKAGKMYIETIIVAVVIYEIISISGFKGFIETFPFIIFLFLIINIIVGKWKGLRLVEIYRFRSVIKEKSKDYV